MRKAIVLLAALLAALTLSGQALAATALPQDGDYLVEAVLTGGSGRASVTSPAPLTVQDGQAVATVEWSSPYYEFMVLDGVTYYPLETDGNATFAIPVALDEDLAVSAQTIAMSEPHLVDYTLRFNSATLRSADGLSAGQTAALAAGGAVAVLVLVLALRRRGKRA